MKSLLLAVILVMGGTGRPDASPHGPDSGDRPRRGGHPPAPTYANRDPIRIAIRAGRVVDVERGVVLNDRTIVIRGDRIEAVLGPGVPPPAGMPVIDLSAATVLPGLVDLHTHLIGDIQSSSPTAPLDYSAVEDLRLGVANARKTLEAGFTTVRDVGTYRGLLDVTLKRAIERGEVVGPRMAVAGAYITKPYGGGEVVGRPLAKPIPPEFRMGVAKTPAEVRARVRYLLAHGADFIKVIATGAVLTAGTEPGVIEVPEASIRAAVLEAARHATYVTAHAHGAEGIKAALRAGVRSIEHGSLIDDEGIALLREKGAWLVADIYNGDYISEVGRRDHWPAEILRKNDETTETQRAGFRKAVAAGVRLGYGTDSGVYPHGDNARQFRYMVRYGMTPMQAIQSATIEAARLMRWDDRIGSIAAGKFADLLAVEGNPLEKIEILERVAFVMKGGVVVKQANR